MPAVFERSARKPKATNYGCCRAGDLDEKF